MKKLLLVLFLAATACKAQSPELPLYNTLEYGKVAGAYFKDIDNSLNPFVGTWELSSATITLRITLEKKIQYYNSFSNLYEDLLVGEYRFVENGIEKVNTLNLLTSPPANLYGHNISSIAILGNQHRPTCSDCAVNEKRVVLSFSDPARDPNTGLLGKIIIRRMDIGSIQKIQLKLLPAGNVLSIDGQPAPPSSFNVPWGTYTLTKI